MRDRIKMLMESQHMAQNSFAQFIGLSPATLSSIFNGRTNPTLATVEAIHSKLPRLNIDWLMFGTGQMYKNSNTAENDNVKDGEANSTEPTLFSNPDTSAIDVNQDVNQTAVSTRNFQQNSINIVAKNIDKVRRTITEIRVFYDDHTYESFVPRK